MFFRMLMPKKNRVQIFEYLFKEGVLVAKKDFSAPKHPEIDVPNLHVIKALTVGVLLLKYSLYHVLRYIFGCIYIINVNVNWCKYNYN